MHKWQVYRKNLKPNPCFKTEVIVLAEPTCFGVKNLNTEISTLYITPWPDEFVFFRLKTGYYCCRHEQTFVFWQFRKKKLVPNYCYAFAAKRVVHLLSNTTKSIAVKLLVSQLVLITTVENRLFFCFDSYYILTTARYLYTLYKY